MKLLTGVGVVPENPRPCDLSALAIVQQLQTYNKISFFIKF